MSASDWAADVRPPRPAVSVQHQRRDSQAEQRNEDDVPEVLAGTEIHPRLEHQGDRDDEKSADHTAQEGAEDGGSDPRPPISLTCPPRAGPALSGGPAHPPSPAA